MITFTNVERNEFLDLSIVLWDACDNAHEKSPAIAIKLNGYFVFLTPWEGYMWGPRTRVKCRIEHLKFGFVENETPITNERDLWRHLNYHVSTVEEL